MSMIITLRNNIAATMLFILALSVVAGAMLLPAAAAPFKLTVCMLVVTTVSVALLITLVKARIAVLITITVLT